jgi:hypothetical protein
VVKPYVEKLMQFTRKEQDYIAKFFDGIYEPALLFDDRVNCKRILHHPTCLPAGRWWSGSYSM